MPIIIIVVVMLLHDAAGTLVQNEVGLAGYLIVRGVNGYHHLNFVGTFDKCPVPIIMAAAICIFALGTAQVPK